jgi:hypothetical protein
VSGNRQENKELRAKNKDCVEHRTLYGYGQGSKETRTQKKYFSDFTAAENIFPYEKILFSMRKYLSAGDNTIRILSNFFSMENILSYAVKLNTKFILFGKYFSYSTRQKDKRINFFPIFFLCCIFPILF